MYHIVFAYKLTYHLKNNYIKIIKLNIKINITHRINTINT